MSCDNISESVIPSKGLFIKFNVARRTKFISKGGEGVGAYVILFVTSGSFVLGRRGGGPAKMIKSFVFWATLNFMNGP